MRATRNRVYRKLYRGFESPYLRHKFYPPYGGLNLCGGAGEWTHLQSTVAKGSHDSWQEQVRMHAVRALRVVSKANKSLTIRQYSGMYVNTDKKTAVPRDFFYRSNGIF